MLASLTSEKAMQLLLVGPGSAKLCEGLWWLILRLSHLCDSGTSLLSSAYTWKFSQSVTGHARFWFNSVTLVFAVWITYVSIRDGVPLGSAYPVEEPFIIATKDEILEKEHSSSIKDVVVPLIPIVSLLQVWLCLAKTHWLKIVYWISFQWTKDLVSKRAKGMEVKFVRKKVEVAKRAIGLLGCCTHVGEATAIPPT